MRILRQVHNSCSLTQVQALSISIRSQFLIDMQEELRREEAQIRSTLIDIQNMVLPNMDSLQKHIAHLKMLIHDNNFSIVNHMIELSIEV